MTRKDFVEKFQSCKQNAHRFLVKNPNGFSIKRGPRVISSYFEDLFAVYVAEKIGNKEFKYYVDKSFSYKIGSSNKTCKPDLLVVNSKLEVVAYFDVKTDLGSHKSSFHDFIKEKNDFIESLKTGKSKLTATFSPEIEGEKEEVIEVSLVNDIKYYIVVGGFWAHSKENQSKYEGMLNVCPNVRLNFLVDWTRNKSHDFIDREDDFDQLDQFLYDVSQKNS